MMDKRMTSGEIAKKAGISQKAVRLYDEKGLLKPSEYSEGNYRLYDREALLVLENIIALKRIGFSLEEIRDNLIVENNIDIQESLNRQLDLMERRKAEIERTISCIRGVLARTEGEPDWNTVAEIARMIQMDQASDESYYHSRKHNAENGEWYVRVYDSLGLKEGSRVLDLGCGFAKIWRNSWRRIPQGVKIEGVDLHGSWADNFADYIEREKDNLAPGSEAIIHWMDVEGEELWNTLEKGVYDYVVAHFLMKFIKNKELLLERVADCLAEGGVFSCNHSGVAAHHVFWQQVFADMQLSPKLIVDEIAQKQAEHEEFKSMLEKYFGKVGQIKLSNSMRYDNSDEVFDKLCKTYESGKKYLEEHEGEIKAYVDKVVAEKGEFVVPSDVAFWRCYK
ncbi:MAG: MerR family transcriptional regulator [Lachnospiraceae bacterium]|nr:MerR family transcriptional regulator [Lachnospiraceae bacterium]